MGYLATLLYPLGFLLYLIGVWDDITQCPYLVKVFQHLVRKKNICGYGEKGCKTQPFSIPVPGASRRLKPPPSFKGAQPPVTPRASRGATLPAKAPQKRRGFATTTISVFPLFRPIFSANLAQTYRPRTLFTGHSSCATSRLRPLASAIFEKSPPHGLLKGMPLRQFDGNVICTSGGS